ncbi:protein translocase subunit SecD [Mariniblastus fucicola]|nr:protein translocase subunit SecD [Mariniblastus fucicola]
MSDSILATNLSGMINLLAQANTSDVAQKASGEVSFFQSGTFGFLLLLAVMFLGWFLAKSISSSLRLPEYRSRLMLAIMPIMLGGLLIYSGWPPRFGVDLRGGMNMVGSLNLAGFPEENRPKVQDIIDQLIKRVNPSGTMEIVIRPLGDDKIEVTIPDVTSAEADNIWQLLVSAGKLEFRIVGHGKFHEAEFNRAEEEAANGYRGKAILDEDGKKIAFWCPIARVELEPGQAVPAVIPYKYSPDSTQLFRDQNTGNIVSFRNMPLSRDQDLHGADFARYCEENGIRPQILMIEPRPDENVEGSHLAVVSRGTDNTTGRPIVQFETTAEGAGQLGMLTGMNEPTPGGDKRLLGIVIDDKLHSAPSINSRISKRGIIEGDFTVKEIDDLVLKLQSGKMKAALNKNPISKNFVESLLGQELRSKGIWAIGVSLLLVLIFMVFYYRFAGIVAAISLVLNIILILAIVMAIQQPLTLTGLAGLVLTVGMSVDANVLIFERIREEMDRGSTLRMAIRNGFDKARTTIVDANVTTLITAIVLYTVGTEQVKGFAVTLILGILISMFTAIFCSRIIFDIAERKRWLTKLSMTRILDKKKFDFLSKIGLTGVMSALFIGLGIAGMFLLGSKLLDHDLRGGSTIRVVFDQPQEIEEIRETLKNKDLEVKGEKIEFSVASFGGADQDPADKDRIFRVDSNLPAWEGGPESEKWVQLDELMTELFPGKLKLHKVDVLSGAGADVGSWKTQSPVRTASWRSAPAVASILAGPTMMLQDEGAAEPSISADPETTEPQDENAEQSEPSTDEEDDKPVLTGGDLPVDEDPEVGNGGGLSFTTETAVKIDPPILGKSLRSEIVESARRLEMELEDEQIVLISDAILEGENADGTVSDSWTIKLNVPQEKDGAAIINKWSEDLNAQPYFPTSSKVGSQIAESMRVNAALAIIFSLIGIIAYIWARFQNIAFGLAAVVALLHDVLVVLGMIALSHYVFDMLGFSFLGIDKFKISLEIIAALLTVIGYSLNDTIVVFDRIREVRGKRKQITSDMINTSISQTLSRTILTSVTTFVVVFILYCFGGEAIHGFAFSLVVGVIVGTYSSIFIASPALLWLMNTIGLSPEPVDDEKKIAGQV